MGYIGAMSKGQEFQLMIQKMKTVLVDAQEERGQKKNFQPDPIADIKVQPEWILFERQALLQAVNAQRKIRGFPDITEAELYRVECFASGHCDYTAKFALYSAELALGETPRHPDLWPD